MSLHLSAGLERRGHRAPIAALFVDPQGLPAIVGTRTYHLAPRWLGERFARSKELTYLFGPLVLLIVVMRALRGVDLLNPHNLPGPLIAALLASSRRPVVWTCNEVPEPIPPDQAPHLGRFERAVWRVGWHLARWAVRAARRILVPSDKTARSVELHYRREATVVNHGVDATQYRVDRDEGPRRAAARLLCVAKLHPGKNVGLAIRTLAAVRARHPDTTLTIVGEGPMRAYLERLAACLAVSDRITYRVRLSLAELRDLYRDSDVLLVPSIGAQSWALTPFEALAAGTPSVVSTGTGAADILRSHEAALVVEPEEAAFADAVLRLLEDGRLARRIVANGRLLVESTLTWDRYVERCAAVFAEVLAD